MESKHDQRSRAHETRDDLAAQCVRGCRTLLRKRLLSRSILGAIGVRGAERFEWEPAAIRRNVVERRSRAMARRRAGHRSRQDLFSRWYLALVLLHLSYLCYSMGLSPVAT